MKIRFQGGEDTENRKELYRRWLYETGPDGLTDQQLLEAYLGVAHVKDARALSKKLMAHYTTVWNVLSSSVRELMSIRGVGEKTAVLISCLGNIYLRGQAQYERSQAVTSPDLAARLLMPRFRGLDTEAVYVMYLDGFLLPLGVDLIARGSAMSARLDLFPVLGGAMGRDAGNVIIAHNHPTCDPLPSDSDRAITADLRATLASLGIRLLDHMIISGDTYVSLAADGLLDTVAEGRYRIPADPEVRK